MMIDDDDDENEKIMRTEKSPEAQPAGSLSPPARHRGAPPPVLSAPEHKIHSISINRGILVISVIHQIWVKKI